MENISDRTWEKQIPNKEGYWLRVNAGHQVSLHKVWKYELNPYKNKLVILWGWSGEKGILLVDSEEGKIKLSDWLWYGPILFPVEGNK